MTPTQLKAWINNKSKESNIPSDLLMRSYMMGKLVEKISESDYKDNFVVKGGFLLGSVFGIENRTTMDLDTTVRKMKVTEGNLDQTFNEILDGVTEEGIEFSLKDLKEIRDADFYPGFRANLQAKLGKMNVDLKVDVTTGDVIYPEAIEYDHKLMFEDKSVEIMAYPLEQVLAEKLHATIYLEETNTRARDFYDIYMLNATDQVDVGVLAETMDKTFKARGMMDPLSDYIEETVPILETSDRLRSIWNNYSKSKRNPYAESLEFDDVIGMTSDLLNKVKDYENGMEAEEEFQFGDD
ncbi:nucleotidyl transferase AbiEii/AbiGii toxin family protein [Enterococcus hulanensis]|uniref:nucleotidyl transferase AbiEii/AbiGii toxin family protein n=1 Tax=Enterococcus hulanensis TaxID=2559929 RepID=UPI0010F55EC8|nr:nucleotidyl transferase AbiEii/AbiGii toxin family protein [Enterococcus hulanensis]